MRNKLIVLIALALLIGASSAFAASASLTAYEGGSGLGTVRTVTFINNAGNGDFADTVASVTKVIPGKCLLIGYSIDVTNANSDGTVQLLDAVAATTGDIDTLTINESEATVSLPVFKIFPQGISFSTGLRVKQGPYTAVTVYFTQVIG